MVQVGERLPYRLVQRGGISLREPLEDQAIGLEVGARHRDSVQAHLFLTIAMWNVLRLVADYPEPGELPMAAVLAPLFEDEDGQVRTVLIKRPETMPTHAGHIAFPGGRPDPADDGPVATALRETHEEVGIEASQVEVLGFLPPIHTVEYSLLVVPVVGRVSTPLGLVPSQREVAKLYTPLLEDLAEPSHWWHVPWNGSKVWYYELEGDTLWGATARMVRQLVGLDPH